MPLSPHFSLLAKRRLGPLFLVQFLGAFNDNLLKYALLFLANFVLYAADPARAKMLATIATGLFILPYFFFSALAGQLADRYDKARLIRWIKAAEVAIMCLALAGFWMLSVPLLLTALFCMGLHSTLFGPVKYSILPQQLAGNELMGGTGLVEAGTFLAILAGQLLAGVISVHAAGMVLMALAVLGLAASFAVPPAPPLGKPQHIDRNVFKSTWEIISISRRIDGVWLAILDISWLFAAGAVLVSQFAPLVSDRLASSQEVATLFLVVFSLAIAAGSLAINRLQKGEVSARYVPVSALFMALGLIDLWLSTGSFTPQTASASAAQFLATAGSTRILIDLAVVAFAGGMFVVPLYAILQVMSPPEERSRVVAANNILNAGITVLAVLAVGALLAADVDVPGIIGVLGGATLVVAFISIWLLPDTLFKNVVRRMLRVRYRVEVKGLEHMPQPGQPAVMVVGDHRVAKHRGADRRAADHRSLLDGLLLAAFLPGKPTFAIDASIAQSWRVKRFAKLFKAFPVDPAKPMPAKAMIRTVREGNTLVLFARERPAANGAPAKVFDGPGRIAEKADADLIAVRLDDPGYEQGKTRSRWSPGITVTVLAPRPLTAATPLPGCAARYPS